MSLKNLSDVRRWGLRKEYRKIELVKCPECEVYFEDNYHCPGCSNELENETDRIEGWIKKK